MSPVREARLIIPANTSVQNSEFERDLIHDFGGFTSFEVYGGWFGNSGPEYEYGTAYDIAVPDNAETYDKLEALTKNVKRRFKQDSVYLRFPNGEVRFI